MKLCWLCKTGLERERGNGLTFLPTPVAHPQRERKRNAGCFWLHYFANVYSSFLPTPPHHHHHYQSQLPLCCILSISFFLLISNGMVCISDIFEWMLDSRVTCSCYSFIFPATFFETNSPPPPPLLPPPPPHHLTATIFFFFIISG